MKFGKRIQTILSIKNMTQRELSDKAGISEVTLSRYIHENREPKADILVNIANALNVSIDYLLGRVDDPDIKIIDSNLPEDLQSAGIEKIAILKEFELSDLTYEEFKGLLEVASKIKKTTK